MVALGPVILTVCLVKETLKLIPMVKTSVCHLALLKSILQKLVESLFAFRVTRSVLVAQDLLIQTVKHVRTTTIRLLLVSTNAHLDVFLGPMQMGTTNASSVMHSVMDALVLPVLTVHYVLKIR